MSDPAKVDTAAVVKAVTLAVVAGIALGVLIGLVGYWLVVAGVLTEDAIENSLIVHGFVFCLGQSPNVIAGYLAARFAGRNEIFNGAAAGTAMLAISAFFYLVPDEDPFTMLDTIALLLMVPVAIAGAGVVKSTA